MDGAIDLSKARELVSDSALWPRVRDFLWDFAPQIHESWIEDLLAKEKGGNKGVLSSSDLANQHVKTWILKELGIKPCFADFPVHDPGRILLLEGEVLESVVKWLGAIACAADLRKVTAGSEVKALKEAIPGVYPEVFGFTAYFAGLDLQCACSETARLEDRVASIGYEILKASVSGAAAPLLTRLKLKLPKKFSSVVSATACNAQMALPAVRKLLKFKFPEAYSLCFS